MKYLILVLLIFPFTAFAEFMPSQNKIKLINDIEQGKLDKAKLMYFSLEANTNNAPFMVIDSIERVGENFLVATNLADSDGKTIYPKYSWISVNCNSKHIKNYGSIKDGIFTRLSPLIESLDSSLNNLTKMFCGTNYENKTYFLYFLGINQLANTYTPLFYTASDNFIDGQRRNLILINPEMNQNKISGIVREERVQVNCEKQNVYLYKKKQTINSDFKNEIYFLINQVCNPNVAFYRGDKFLSSKKVNNDVNSNKVEISDLKTQCKELGFKEGSKKFKDCVVELME